MKPTGWTELPQDRVQKRGVEPSGSVTRQLQPRSSGQFGILHNRELQLRWGGNTTVCVCVIERNEIIKWKSEW
jgi:hypothetical protein